MMAKIWKKFQEYNKSVNGIGIILNENAMANNVTDMEQTYSSHKIDTIKV